RPSPSPCPPAAPAAGPCAPAWSAGTGRPRARRCSPAPTAWSRSTTSRRSRRSAVSRFRPLTVSAVDRLTDDAVAVTFAERMPFVQGQHLTLRAVIDGQEVRRSYSICSPAGGPLRVAVKRLPGGVFSAYANERLRP